MHSITVLDGGLGTTLEDILGDEVAQSPLWSTQAVINYPTKIVDAHLSFLDAGARIIETATYQASIPNLVQAGLNEDEAREAILSAVRLASQATLQFERPLSRHASIALSLGPFGATLRPTQEFLGFYPPPYGPWGYQENGTNAQAFDSSKDELAATDALAKFHLDRLLHISGHSDVWNNINYLAFETVLLPREVLAIRKAIGLLKHHLTSSQRTFSQSWWISFVFPEVSKDACNTTSSKIDQLVTAALHPHPPHDVDSPIPNGIGINCTSILHLLPLAKGLARSVHDLKLTSAQKHIRDCDCDSKDQDLYLVLYPNGGVYDTENQCWSPQAPDADLTWAGMFKDALSEITSDENPWKKIIVGGCCRTNPSYIKALCNQLMDLESQ
ncbi:Homocysteine S-methyltransferase [Coprinopsis marcescibilis]|uniref:Homocysteine S-methyltransferase n=1 Tax=Coprinopsis marcescibilis TaxID=230819 RepID=A0A5C3KZ82_COPMA|nr:Homocysteine S-methyltransferase [Coprinopsis marcescibilis]